MNLNSKIGLIDVDGHRSDELECIQEDIWYVE